MVKRTKRRNRRSPRKASRRRRPRFRPKRMRSSRPRARPRRLRLSRSSSAGGVADAAPAADEAAAVDADAVAIAVAAGVATTGAARRRRRRRGADREARPHQPRLEDGEGRQALRLRGARVVGDGKGRAGFGHGKAREVPEAINKATAAAKKAMIRVPLRDGRTLHHDGLGHFGAGRVTLRAAPPGPESSPAVRCARCSRASASPTW
jgi:hypothetical protein